MGNTCAVAQSEVLGETGPMRCARQDRDRWVRVTLVCPRFCCSDREDTRTGGSGQESGVQSKTGTKSMVEDVVYLFDGQREKLPGSEMNMPEQNRTEQKKSSRELALLLINVCWRKNTGPRRRDCQRTSKVGRHQPSRQDVQYEAYNKCKSKEDCCQHALRTGRAKFRS